MKQDKSCDFLEIVQFRWHKQRLEMTKTELQTALAAATQTNKKTAGVFLDTLSNLTYKAIKKEGEFVLPGFGKLVRRKGRLAWASIRRHRRRSGFRLRLSSSSESQGGKGRDSGGKEVVRV